MKFIFWTLLFFTQTQVWSKPKPVVAPKSKQFCTDRDLKRQDCNLNFANYSLRLLTKSIASGDGIWQTVTPMPLSGESTGWEKVHFSVIGDWPILQLWLWDKNVSETRVESLHWYVIPLKPHEMKVLQEGIVRQRRLKTAETDAPGPPVYLYDAWESHALKLGSHGNLEWQLGTEKKVLEKSTPTIKE